MCIRDRNPTQSQLASAQSLQIQAVLTGAQGTVSWRSSDPTIAAVSSDGTVTNVYTGSGTAQVTITATLGSLSASTVLTLSLIHISGHQYWQTG